MHREAREQVYGDLVKYLVDEPFKVRGVIQSKTTLGDKFPTLSKLYQIGAIGVSVTVPGGPAAVQALSKITLSTESLIIETSPKGMFVKVPLGVLAEKDQDAVKRRMEICKFQEFNIIGATEREKERRRFEIHGTTN